MIENNFLTRNDLSYDIYSVFNPCIIKLNKKGQPFLWDSGESGTRFMCEWEWVSASLSIILMDRVG